MIKICLIYVYTILRNTHISFKLQDCNGQECSIFYDNHSVIMQTLYNFRSAVISPFLAHKFHYLCFIMEEVIA